MMLSSSYGNHKMASAQPPYRKDALDHYFADDGEKSEALSSLHVTPPLIHGVHFIYNRKLSDSL